MLSQRRKYKIAILLLVVLLASLAYFVVKIFNEKPADFVEKEKYELPYIEDEPAPKEVVPLYQQDEAWADDPYLGGTISSHGCGLVCATIALDYYTYQDVNPYQVSLVVIDGCSTAGVNDMGKFSKLLQTKVDGLEVSEQLWTLESMKSLIDGSEQLAFCGLSGEAGANDYEGHVVLLSDFDESGAFMCDPASEENTRKWLWQELEEIDFAYFYMLTNEVSR